MRSWKTTLFGCTAMALTALHVAGVTVGKIGNTDYVTFGAITCGAAFAYFCKDRDDHSTWAQVEKSSGGK